MEWFGNINWAEISWAKVFTSEAFATFCRVLVLLTGAIPAAYLVGKLIKKKVTARYSKHHGMLAGRIFYYAMLAFVVVAILRDLNFELTPLLGAAGVVGIAVGFASQTSVSNVISGLFLIAEKPFAIGDIVNIADTTGEVLSVDMLSVKLRTFDNQFVRLPNETIIKSKVTNISRFPIRRIDIQIGVAYKEKISHVRETLLSVARDTPQCLQEPEPVIIFSGFGDSSLNFLFAVWAKREEWLTAKNAIQEKIKERFDEEQIEIPFPQRTIHFAPQSDPFFVNGMLPDSLSAPAGSRDLREGGGVPNGNSQETGHNSRD